MSAELNVITQEEESPQKERPGEYSENEQNNQNGNIDVATTLRHLNNFGESPDPGLLAMLAGNKPKEPKQTSVTRKRTDKAGSKKSRQTKKKKPNPVSPADVEVIQNSDIMDKSDAHLKVAEIKIQPYHTSIST